MANAAYKDGFGEKKTLGSGYVFGAPVKDFGIFGILLIGVASGFIAFFLGTFVGIVSMLVAKSNGHNPDFGLTYRYVGLPAGALVAMVVLGYLGTFWAKRVLRKG